MYGLGSIRSPAATHGVYGLRPSRFRTSTDGWSCWAANVDEISGVIGSPEQRHRRHRALLESGNGCQTVATRTCASPSTLDTLPSRQCGPGSVTHQHRHHVARRSPSTASPYYPRPEYDGIEARRDDYSFWRPLRTATESPGPSSQALVTPMVGTKIPLLPLTQWIGQTPYHTEYAKLWNKAAVDANKLIVPG